MLGHTSVVLVIVQDDTLELEHVFAAESQCPFEFEHPRMVIDTPDGVPLGTMCITVPNAPFVFAIVQLCVVASGEPLHAGFVACPCADGEQTTMNSAYKARATKPSTKRE